MSPILRCRVRVWVWVSEGEPAIMWSKICGVAQWVAVVPSLRVKQGRNTDCGRKRVGAWSSWLDCTAMRRENPVLTAKSRYPIDCVHPENRIGYRVLASKAQRLSPSLLIVAVQLRTQDLIRKERKGAGGNAHLQGAQNCTISALYRQSCFHPSDHWARVCVTSNFFV